MSLELRDDFGISSGTCDGFRNGCSRDVEGDDGDDGDDEVG
jgi:hypothetical protein